MVFEQVGAESLHDAAMKKNSSMSELHACIMPPWPSMVFNVHLTGAMACSTCPWLQTQESASEKGCILTSHAKCAWRHMQLIVMKIPVGAEQIWTHDRLDDDRLLGFENSLFSKYSSAFPADG